MQDLWIAAIVYMIGSFPSGLVFGKLFWGIDLREHGSKNIGATNAYRVLGKGPAFLIFFADFFKGAVGVVLGSYFGGAPIDLVVGGIFSIVGHNWSLFLGFRGGKGVATGLGVIAMLMPKVTVLVFAVWFLLVYWRGYVSLASIVAAALVPFAAFVFGEPEPYLYFGLLAAVFVIYRHKSNIGRLMNGTESKIQAGKRR